MTIGSKTFDTKSRAYLMGILNVTPDSFFDGGRFFDLNAAVCRAEKMISEGADIIDVGGQSTRPGYKEVSAQEEIDRAVPVIAAIKARFDIPVSVDTYKSEVAQAAIHAGADMVNDVYGLRYDEKMAPVIADAGVVCVITHNGAVKKYRPDIRASLRLAAAAGILNEKIIIDPGIGFGKTVEENLWCIANLSRFGQARCAEGCGSDGIGGAAPPPYEYPLLVGASNKSVIGAVLGVPEGERLYGTLATTAIAVLNGAAFIRVHDVKPNKQVVAMTEAIKKGELAAVCEP